MLTVLWIQGLLVVSSGITIPRSEPLNQPNYNLGDWKDHPNCGRSGNEHKDPWFASIQVEPSQREERLCSAILVTQSHLLTSNCPSLASIRPDNDALWVDFENHGERIKVSFEPEAIFSTNASVFLLTLERPIPRNSPIVPICMRQQSFKDLESLGERTVVCQENGGLFKCQSSADCSFVTIDVGSNGQSLLGIHLPSSVEGCQEVNEGEESLLRPSEQMSELLSKIQPIEACPKASFCDGKITCSHDPSPRSKRVGRSQEITFPLATNMCPVYEMCSDRSDESEFQWVQLHMSIEQLSKECQTKEASFVDARIRDEIPTQSSSRPEKSPFRQALEANASGIDDYDSYDVDKPEIQDQVELDLTIDSTRRTSNKNGSLPEFAPEPDYDVLEKEAGDPCDVTPSNGAKCQFPFMYDGEVRHECVRDVSQFNHDDSMCPSEIDPNTQEGVKWVKCTESCPLEKYHAHHEIEKDLRYLEDGYPDHVRVYDIGTSVNGEPLWVINLSANLNNRSITETEQFQLRPRVKFIGNMHGNEPVGRELLIHLAKYLLKGHEQNDSETTNILEEINLSILPTMNPDGFSRGNESFCSGGTYEKGRLNEGRKDLNRNFPTWLDWRRSRNSRFDIEAGREKETLLLMDWIMKGYFHLSANFHDGAVLVNYPWDNYHGSEPPRGIYGTPDHDVFVSLAKSYSLNNRVMADPEKQCLQWGPFENGITNGADWYPVEGGMQDFNYMFAGTMEVLVEVSCCKYPPRKELLIHWNDNRRSLLAYTKQALKGIKGFVRDSASDEPIKEAKIAVKSDGETDFREFPARSDQHGAYRKILQKEGQYTAYAFIEARNQNRNGRFEIVAKSEEKTFKFDPSESEAQRIDFVIDSQRASTSRQKQSRRVSTSQNVFLGFNYPEEIQGTVPLDPPNRRRRQPNNVRTIPGTFRRRWTLS